MADDPADAANRMQGVVKKWFDEKGFGFIKPDAGGDDVFLHVTAIKAARLVGHIDEGDRVEFEVAPGKDGKGLKAVNLKALA